MVPSADRCAHDALYDHGLAGPDSYFYLSVVRNVGAFAVDKEAEPAKG